MAVSLSQLFLSFIHIDTIQSSSVQSLKKTSSTVKPTKPGTAKAAGAPAPARVIAESASEEEAVSSDGNSDDSFHYAEDVSPNEDEFRTEVRRLILCPSIQC